MIDAAGCGAPSSPSGGALAGAARDLAAQHAVGSPEGWCRVAESGAGVGVGARVSWRGRRRHHAGRDTPASPLAGHRQSQTRTCAGRWRGSATAGARGRQPATAGPSSVVTRGGILLGHGVAPEGARYTDRMAAAEAADEEAEAHIILCVFFVWWCFECEVVVCCCV